MTLISTVGGASGPLYGTFFMRMGAACANKTELAGQDLAGGIGGRSGRRAATRQSSPAKKPWSTP